MSANLSVTTEDYLKSIYELNEYKGFATLADISQILGTARQTVYDEIKILLDKNFVKRNDRGKYSLTEDGEREANLFLRKHRVAEILLWKGLNMKWSKLDDQAMGIEHGMTEEIISAACKKFDCEKCPHGNPVPDSNGRVSVPSDLKYKELDIERRYFLNRVIFETPDILKFLEENSLLPDIMVMKEDNPGRLRLNNNRTVSIPDYILDALRFRK
ncbi:MAG: metal-dependent transcriptional regulator [Candidatus Thermoplasmatota archaeon]|nr:metal-dependent transcriptional regulator [Candidatus Thermoplasmatota archaeon]